MPNTPYAKLLAAVNGGAVQSGGIDAAVADVIQLSFESTVGWSNASRTEVHPPDGMALPAGWTAATEGGHSYFYYLGNTPPPPFTIGPWGKYHTRLLANGGGGDKTDETLAIDVVSTSLGLHDLGYREDGQFGGSAEKWTQDQRENLRTFDAAIAGAVALTSTAPTTIEPDDAAAVGVGTTAARHDHRHAIAAAAPSTIGTANAEGSSASFARADHVHAHGTVNANGHIQEVTQTIEYTELTGLGAGVTSFTKSIGSTLATRYLLGVYIKPDALFTDGGAGVYDLDVGVSGAETVLASSINVGAGASTSNPVPGNGVSHVLGHPLTAAQYQLRLQSTVDLNTTTNGYVAVKLIYYMSP